VEYSQYYASIVKFKSKNVQMVHFWLLKARLIFGP